MAIEYSLIQRVIYTVLDFPHTSIRRNYSKNPSQKFQMAIGRRINDRVFGKESATAYLFIEELRNFKVTTNSSGFNEIRSQ